MQMATSKEISLIGVGMDSMAAFIRVAPEITDSYITVVEAAYIVGMEVEHVGAADVGNGVGVELDFLLAAVLEP